MARRLTVRGLSRSLGVHGRAGAHLLLPQSERVARAQALPASASTGLLIAAPQFTVWMTSGRNHISRAPGNANVSSHQTARRERRRKVNPSEAEENGLIAPSPSQRAISDDVGRRAPPHVTGFHFPRRRLYRRRPGPSGPLAERRGPRKTLPVASSSRGCNASSVAGVMRNAISSRSSNEAI